MSFIYDMVDTWNAAGTTFTAIKMNVTNTASASTSKLMDLLKDNVTQFSVRRDGYLNGPSNNIVFSGPTVGTEGYLYAANEIFAVGSQGNASADFVIELGVQNVIVTNNATRLGWSSVALHAGDASNLRAGLDVAFSRIGAADLALGNGTASDASANLRVGSLRVNQTPTANGSAATTITNGADSATNLGHRAQFSMNGTAYWFPCGSVAF